ncbi:MAG: tryptophan--tRNA ligase [Patescibacteria group bacterium]
MKRVLSGMQPSGKPHLGNYLGAMRQHVALSNDKNYECFYFIANYHALTTVRKADDLRNWTHNLALDYLALGLDTERTAFFIQSAIPELTELTWIFDCITNVGFLERAHAWKDAKAKGKKDPSMGLFNYPVLMSADILMYLPSLVPVGKDQKQHVEMARDIAQSFNHLFGNTFSLPDPIIGDDVSVVPGTDGQKMSKSYGNTIDIFADEDELKSQVFSVKTDSMGVNEPKDPSKVIPFQLYKFFAPQSDVKEVEDKLRNGGIGYGDLKKKLFEALIEYFADARAKRAKLVKDPKFVADVLSKGATRAREVAHAIMADVRKKTGLSSSTTRAT